MTELTQNAINHASGPIATQGTVTPGAGEGAGNTLVIVADMKPNSASQITPSTPKTTLE